MRRRFGVAAAAASATVLLSGCHVGAQASKGFGDSGVQQGETKTAGAPGIDTRKANIIEMPDRYANVAWKCEPGHLALFSSISGQNRIWMVIDPAMCP